MSAILFIFIGGCGLLFINVFGYRLLKRKDTTSKRFACFIACSYAILIISLALLTHKIDIGWIIVSLLLGAINFGVGYPIAYFFHQHKSGKY